MIEIYCKRQHHSKNGLCAQCQPLLDYAMQRIAKCPYKDNKPTCAQCPIHCYKSDMRAQVRQVMKEAGPWMLIYHPVLAFFHLMDGTSGTHKRKPGEKSNGQ